MILLSIKQFVVMKGKQNKLTMSPIAVRALPLVLIFLLILIILQDVGGFSLSAHFPKVMNEFFAYCCSSITLHSVGHFTQDATIDERTKM